MPGTPVIPPEPKEDHFTKAHRLSLEMAAKSADPILRPQLFNTIYWVAMQGFGFVPYRPGIHL